MTHNYCRIILHRIVRGQIYSHSLKVSHNKKEKAPYNTVYTVRLKNTHGNILELDQKYEF